ncbi:MAG: hypothetical protein ACYTG1_06535, partial [Planctomycetota bacterium]
MPARPVILSSMLVAGSLAWAHVPAAAKSFVLDGPSPSGCPTSAGACIFVEGPTVTIDMTFLGLVASDVIDAISLGDDPVRGTLGTREYLFSVSRPSQGLAGTGVAASHPDHEADLFLWELVIGDNTLCPTPDGWAGADGEEFNAGLVTTGSGDDVNGLEESDLTWPGGGDPNPGAAPSYEIYFSLRAGSPSLAVYGVSEADILVVGGTYGSTPALFLDATQLGIPAGVAADLDALALEIHPGGTAVRYSVTSASTPLNLTGPGIPVNSGAAIIASRGLGTGRLVRAAFQLGLRPADDLDGLEMRLAPSVVVQAFGLAHELLGTATASYDGQSGLTVSNIGNPGEDGFRWVPDWPLDELMLELEPIGPAPDGSVLELAFDLDDELGHFAFEVADAGEAIELHGPWTEVRRVQLVLGGAVQAETEDIAVEKIATLMDDTAWPIGCAAQVLRSFEEIEVTFRLPAPTPVELPDGQVGTADLLIVLLAAPPGPAPGITAVSLACSGIGQVHVTDESIESSCPADVDGDRQVGVNDLLIVLALWGGCGDPVCAADIDRDQLVGINDLLRVLGDWGG